MNTSIILLFFCSFLFVLPLTEGQYPEYFDLATGNGILQAEQTSDTSGKITETLDFSPYWEPQQWVFEQDSRFPTGVFIYCEAYPDLVWESSGGQSNAGNPIILSQKTDTSDATSYQRWIYSDNQLSLVANPNVVVSVNSNAPNQLTLANKNISDPRQKIYQILPQNALEVTIVAFFPSPVIVSFSSIAGNLSGEQDWVGYTYWLPLGAWIGVYYNNILVFNTTITDPTDQYFTISRNDLPIGTSVWTGWANNNENSAAVTWTWSSDLDEFDNHILTGYGTDTFGAFNIQEGSSDPGGNAVFNKAYATFTHICSGTLDETATIIEEGNCYSEDESLYYDFLYTRLSNTCL